MQETKEFSQPFQSSVQGNTTCSRYSPSVGYFTDEELPMTLQVGMLGVDGLVLVGDTKQFKEPRFGYRSSFHGTKIQLSKSSDVAVACARNMNLANRIAEQILSDVDGCEVRERGRRILAAGNKLAEADQLGAECLVAFSGENREIYLFQLTSDGTAHCSIPMDRAISGDTGNSANFWAERYYSQDLSVEQLVRLGAQIIVAGGILNSGSVGGLEVAICDRNGFRKWTDQDSKDLELYTNGIANDIGNRILSRDAL